VLDELDAIINSGQGVVVLAILPDPDIMLSVSAGFLSGIEGFVSLSVLDGLSEVSLGSGQRGDGVVSQLSVRSLLGDVVVDVGVQIGNDSLAGSQVSSVDGIMISLILNDSSHDGVQKNVNFISGGLGLQVGLHGRQNHVSERLGVNLCQNSFCVHEFRMVVQIRIRKYQNQS